MLALVHNEHHAKKQMAFFFRRFFGDKEPCHSENISDEKCYLYRSRRLSCPRCVFCRCTAPLISSSAHCTLSFFGSPWAAFSHFLSATPPPRPPHGRYHPWNRCCTEHNIPWRRFWEGQSIHERRLISNTLVRHATATRMKGKSLVHRTTATRYRS